VPRGETTQAKVLRAFVRDVIPVFFNGAVARGRRRAPGHQDAGATSAYLIVKALNKRLAR
jgi:hypothetical protein